MDLYDFILKLVNILITYLDCDKSNSFYHSYGKFESLIYMTYLCY